MKQGNFEYDKCNIVRTELSRHLKVESLQKAYTKKGTDKKRQMVGLQVKALSFLIVSNWCSDYLISALPQPIFELCYCKVEFVHILTETCHSQ